MKTLTNLTVLFIGTVMFAGNAIAAAGAYTAPRLGERPVEREVALSRARIMIEGDKELTVEEKAASFRAYEKGLEIAAKENADRKIHESDVERLTLSSVVDTVERIAVSQEFAGSFNTRFVEVLKSEKPSETVNRAALPNATREAKKAGCVVSATIMEARFSSNVRTPAKNTGEYFAKGTSTEAKELIEEQARSYKEVAELSHQLQLNLLRLGQKMDASAAVEFNSAGGDPAIGDGIVVLFRELNNEAQKDIVKGVQKWSEEKLDQEITGTFAQELKVRTGASEKETRQFNRYCSCIAKTGTCQLDPASGSYIRTTVSL